MLVATLFLGLAIWLPMSSAQQLPPDAKPTATVPSGLFASWFAGGAPTLNGAVKPADSLNFANPQDDNVPFYQWAEQMFLWLTSPAPNMTDGVQGIVLNSQAFFRVSPPDGANPRQLISNKDRQPRLLALRGAKLGPDGLPVVIDKAGKLYEVKLPVLSRNRRPLIDSSKGVLEVEGIKFVHSGELPFELVSNKHGPILKPKPILPPNLLGRNIVQPFTVPVLRPFAFGHITVFLDSSGNPVDVEEGQAVSNGALISQGGSLVYYLTSVNDEYAYFWKGITSGGISTTPALFPTTQADLDNITRFATAARYTLLNPKALCVQVKTSWVELDTLPPGDRPSYIQMSATIPKFNQSNKYMWYSNDSKPAKLALVGVHIAGSVKGHPEMMWASFEHFGNAPNAAYQYVASDGSTKPVAQSTGSPWLFSLGGATVPDSEPPQVAVPQGGVVLIGDNYLSP
jgi:hypothetical protein